MMEASNFRNIFMRLKNSPIQAVKVLTPTKEEK